MSVGLGLVEQAIERHFNEHAWHEGCGYRFALELPHSGSGELSTTEQPGGNFPDVRIPSRIQTPSDRFLPVSAVPVFLFTSFRSFRPLG